MSSDRLFFSFPWGAHMAPSVVPQQWDLGCVACGTPHRGAPDTPASAAALAACGRGQPRDLARCGGCQVATYCSRACQATDWGRGHKGRCASWGRLHRAGRLEAHLPLPTRLDPDDTPGATRRALLDAIRAAGAAAADLVLVVWPGAGFGWLVPAGAYRTKWRTAVAADRLAAAADAAGGGAGVLPVVILQLSVRVGAWTPSGVHGLEGVTVAGE